MSVVRRNNRGGPQGANVGSFLSSLGSALLASINANPNASRQLFDGAYKVSAGYLAGKKDGTVAIPIPSGPGDWSGPPGGGSARGVKGRTRTRGKGREARQRSSNDPFRQIGFGPTSGTPSVRTVLTGILSLKVPAAGGNSSIKYPIGNIASSGPPNTPLLTILSSDSIKLIGAFEKALVHKVTVRFVGVAASTTSGYIGLGFDSSTDVSVAPPADVTALTNTHQKVVIADIKGECSLSYSPNGTDREVRLAEATAPATEQYAGRLSLVTGGMSLAAAADFGLLTISVDITLLQ